MSFRANTWDPRARMPYFVVEHVFDPPIDPSKAPPRHDETLSPCLGLHSVGWRGSFLSDDHARAFCVYEAPDSDGLRRAYRNAGVPFTNIWATHDLKSPVPSVHAHHATVFVVDERFDPPVDPAKGAPQSPELSPCLRTYGVDWVRSLVAEDGTQCRCVYRAPDADAVRRAYRTAGMAFESVWCSSALDPTSTPHSD